jgi:uncharacterized protein (TIGR00297 family)
VTPPPVITAAEWKRKGLHAGMGLFAFALRGLPWPVAAGLALLAFLGNVLAMPRIGRGIYRDPARSLDPGIVAYPAMVLVLILLFRHDLAIAGTVWVMLAFGDPAASIAGKLLGGPRLAWNREKTWTGLAAGFLAALAAGATLWMFLTRSTGPLPGVLALVAPPAALAAWLETYPSGFDDNWLPPLPAALLLFALSRGALPAWPAPAALLIAVVLNAVIGAATGALEIVSPSGAIAGAILGAVMLAFGGWGAYALLWTFFLAGTLATKLGYRRKALRGTAQAREGRRGAEHAIANAGVASLLVLLRSGSGSLGALLLALAVAGAFAAALSDTFGTEFGSLYGKRAYSLTRLCRVPPGTKGAISLAGTLAGLFGGALIGAVATAVGLVPAHDIGVIAAAGLAGSLSESLLIDLAIRRKISPDHEFVNAFNTLVGALAALEIVISIQTGRLYLPFGGAP